MYEYFITDLFSAGFNGTYANKDNSRKFILSTFINTHTTIHTGLFGNFHLLNLSKNKPKMFDVYVGANVGHEVLFLETSFLGLAFKTSITQFNLSFYVGARALFVEKFGAFAEAGYGGFLSSFNNTYGNFGLYYKIN